MIPLSLGVQIGSKILGSVFGRRSRKKARRAQAAAAAAAQAAQEQARNQIIGNETPFRDAGLAGLRDMQTFKATATDPESVRQDAGYQFQRDEGIRGLEGSAAAGTGLYRGATFKRLADFNSGLANRFYGEAFDRNMRSDQARYGRMSDLAGIGERSTGRMNAAIGGYGDSSANISTSLGNAQAASHIASGNQTQELLTGIGRDIYGQLKTPTTPTAPRGYKDGGPVMAADAVAGGLSRDAVMSALDAVAPKPTIAQPQLENRGIHRAAGGSVHGPGGTRGDEIPAMLSDEEHVITADEVRGFGRGSYAQGHKRLKGLRALMKAGNV